MALSLYMRKKYHERARALSNALNMINQQYALAATFENNTKELMILDNQKRVLQDELDLVIRYLED